MGCAEEVASVHVEGWNLSCRTYTCETLQINHRNTHTHTKEIHKYVITKPVKSVYIRSQVFPSPAADWETYTCGVCCCWGRRGGTQPS